MGKSIKERSANAFPCNSCHHNSCTYNVSRGTHTRREGGKPRGERGAALRCGPLVTLRRVSRYAPQGEPLRCGRALTLAHGFAVTSGQLLPPLHRSPTPLRSALCGSLHSHPYIPLLVFTLNNRKSLPCLTLAISDNLTADAIRLLTNCAAVCLRSRSAPPPLRYCSASEVFVPWLHLNYKVLSS